MQRSLRVTAATMIFALTGCLDVAGLDAWPATAAAESDLIVTPVTRPYATLQSFNFPDRYVRHANYYGEITGVSSEAERKEATFHIVPGLAGQGTVSFEAVNLPGYYLR